MTKNKYDIKELNIPNLCFSLVSENDKRNVEFKKQRIERGFDESETWALNLTIAKFIIPRLELYEKKKKAKDILKREPELIKDIENFLNAMKLIVNNEGLFFSDKEEEEIYNKGIKAFPKIFNSLWW